MFNQLSLAPVSHFFLETVPAQFAGASRTTIGCSVACAVLAAQEALSALSNTFYLVNHRNDQGQRNQQVFNHLTGNITGALFYGACAANLVPGSAVVALGWFALHSIKRNAEPKGELAPGNLIGNVFDDVVSAAYDFITTPRAYNPITLVLTYAAIPLLRKISDVFGAIYRFVTSPKTVVVAALFAGAFGVAQYVLPKYFGTTPATDYLKARLA